MTKLLVMSEDTYNKMLAEKQATFKSLSFPDMKNILHGTLAGLGHSTLP
jgi:hypothetical protein